MAVSGKTSNLEVPFYLGADKPPDMAAVTKAMAERLDTLLSAFATGTQAAAADVTLTEATQVVTKKKIIATVDCFILLWADLVIETTAECNVRMTFEQGVTQFAWHKEKFAVGLRGMSRAHRSNLIKGGEEVEVALVASRVGGAAKVKAAEEFQSGFVYLTVPA